MLQSLNWETLQSCRFHICLYIIYKAHYNLAIFPLLDYAIPATIQTQGNNIKFILPHYSKDFFTLSYPLHSGVGMPFLSHQWRLHPWTCSRPASQVLHTNIKSELLYPALSGSFFVKCIIFLITVCNEVAKVMFLHLSVIHSVHSGHQSGWYASYWNAYLLFFFSSYLVSLSELTAHD